MDDVKLSEDLMALGHLVKTPDGIIWLYRDGKFYSTRRMRRCECIECGAEFLFGSGTGRRKSSRYCSPPCRKKAWIKSERGRTHHENPLLNLPLTTQVLAALHNGGLTTIEQIAATPDVVLMRIPCFGHRTLESVRECIPFEHEHYG